MGVCVYVCVCICMCVCAHSSICVYACIHACVRACVSQLLLHLIVMTRESIPSHVYITINMWQKSITPENDVAVFFQQDVINCIGGIQVLFPLLEQLSQTPSTPREDLPTNGPSPSKDLDCTDWVVVPSSSYAGDWLVTVTHSCLIIHVFTCHETWLLGLGLFHWDKEFLRKIHH